jgi:hypothetical protein
MLYLRLGKTSHAGNAVKNCASFPHDMFLEVPLRAKE